MADGLLPSVLVGLVSGYLSGQFGIGGGVVTTPAIRLILGMPELIAVGTPLPVMIPTTLTGVISYGRRGLVDFKLGLVVGIIGSVFSVVGAWAAHLVGGQVVLIVTAAVICWTAVDMVLLAFGRQFSHEERTRRHDRRSSALYRAGLGALTGLYSGFLGLGGGFIVVPALVRHFGFDTKRAVGTSLVVVSILAVPGSIAHYVLGHVDVGLALALSLGVIPGALLGAHVTAIAQERSVRIGFAVLLLGVGVLLALSELGVV